MPDSRYEAACARFLEALGSEGGVQALLDAGRAALGFPLHLLDPAFRLIAKSGGETLTDPRWTDYLSADATISEERLTALKASGFMSRVQGSGKPTIDSSVPGDTDVIACDVCAGGRILGRLGVWAAKPFAQTELAIVAALGKALAAELRKSESPALARDRYGGFFLDFLLRGGDADGAERLRKRFELELAPPFRMVAVAERDGRGTAARTPQYLARKTEELLPSALCTVADGEVAILLSRGEAAEAALGETIRRHGLSCGASRSFEALSDASECFRQARTALRLGSSSGRIPEYEAVAHLDLLGACARTVPAVSLDFPPVELLSRYDRNYGTDYVRTLEAYIDRSCSMAETARTLGVHYNTVKYRMDVIAEVMGLRVSGIETIFKTALALLLRRDRGGTGDGR